MKSLALQSGGTSLLTWAGQAVRNGALVTGSSLAGSSS